MRKKPVVEYLTDEEMDEIAKSEVPPECDYLNALLDGWKPEELHPDEVLMPRPLIVVRR